MAPPSCTAIEALSQSQDFLIKNCFNFVNCVKNHKKNFTKKLINKWINDLMLETVTEIEKVKVGDNSVSVESAVSDRINGVFVNNNKTIINVENDSELIEILNEENNDANNVEQIDLKQELNEMRIRFNRLEKALNIDNNNEKFDKKYNHYNNYNNRYNDKRFMG